VLLRRPSAVDTSTAAKDQDTPSSWRHRGMPLSRARSLLSNINGGASQYGHSGGGASSSSSGDTPTSGTVVGGSSDAGSTLPGLGANAGAGGGAAAAGALDGSSNGSLLPPLKGTPSKPNSAGVLHGGASGVTSGNNGLLFTSLTSGHQSLYAGYQTASNRVADDNADTMSTTSSLLSAMTTSGHNHHLSQQSSSAATAALATGAAGMHINGMQTLPHVRPSATAEHLHTQQQQQLNGNSTLESPKHQQQQQSQQNGSVSSATSSNNPSANNLKPKTMVATPEQVMKLYMNKLTPYEHHEIFNYPQIYFIGANAKKRPGIIGAPNNCGYDDEQVRKSRFLPPKWHFLHASFHSFIRAGFLYSYPSRPFGLSLRSAQSDRERQLRAGRQGVRP